MEDSIKNVANAVVDDVINGVANEFQAKGGPSSCTTRGRCSRSLLCVMFSPSKCDDIAGYMERSDGQCLG